MINTEGRHRGVVELARFFDDENLAEPLKPVMRVFADAFEDILHLIPEDSAELTAGLRKLLEAKDCAVRAAL